MCRCNVKVEFEIESNRILVIKELEKIECEGLQSCLECTETKEPLEDGIYEADLSCEVNPVRYSEGIEYDGENILTNIKRKEI